MMRAGRCRRTIAYAAEASRRGNQSWFQRGVGGGSLPIACSSLASASIAFRCSRNADSAEIITRSIAA